MMSTRSSCGSARHGTWSTQPTKSRKGGGINLGAAEESKEQEIMRGSDICFESSFCSLHWSGLNRYITSSSYSAAFCVETMCWRIGQTEATRCARGFRRTNQLSLPLRRKNDSTSLNGWWWIHGWPLNKAKLRHTRQNMPRFAWTFWWLTQPS